MRKFFLCLAVLAFFAAPVFRASAEPPLVSVSMKPDSILIGDHVSLRIEVRKDMMQVVDFPVFDKEQKGGVRIIKDLPLDTLEAEGRMQRLVKEYILTSFNAGSYNLEGLKLLYIDKNIMDTLILDDMRLLVATFDVDTANTTIFDIKVPMDAPLMVDEFKGYVIAGILIAAVLAALVWVVASVIARGKRKDSEGGKPKPKISPHVRAIKELERLHNQKLWQNNKHKLYYTHLTDIVRAYLEGRYGVGAMEMTSDEIIAAVSGLGLTDRDFDALSDMLRTSDLVKFAKFVPDAEYNEKVYYNAYYFIEDTKEIVEEVKESEVTEIQPENVSGDEQ